VQPEVLEREEARLLAPFSEPRQVLAQDLEITMSANFFKRVGTPALTPPLHVRSIERDGEADVYRFVNKSGGVEVPLRLMLEETRFVILNTIVLRVLAKSSVTLRALAQGDVTILEAGRPRLDVPRTEIVDGVWRGR
jgi:hypothetical protein